MGFEYVVSVESESMDDGIVIETLKPDEFYSRLPEIVVDNNIRVDQLYSPDDNLEAVFKYLVD